MCGGGDGGGCGNVCAMAADCIVMRWRRLTAAVTHVGHIWRRAQLGGRTALMCAAENGHADCVRLMLDAGADKNAVDEVRASAACLACGPCCAGDGDGLVCERRRRSVASGAAASGNDDV